MARLLIADDQVPESKFSSNQEIRDYYLSALGQQNAKFVEGFVYLRGLIRLLGDNGYEVDCATTPEVVIDLTKRHIYDAIILDLGWDMLDYLPVDERMKLGNPLSVDIRKHSAAPILMFSSRFWEKEDLARTRAELGCLPVYKSYDETCSRHLLVTLRWVIQNRGLNNKLIEEQKLYSFKMYRRLSNVLLGSIVFGMALFGAAIVSIIIGNKETGIASALSGALSSFINGAVYKYVEKYQQDSVRGPQESSPPAAPAVGQTQG